MNLEVRLASIVTSLESVEGNSWRPHAFRRFLIGRLPDGQEEWLEFWRENHLLAPFSELFCRREVAKYCERDIAFLGLRDLIHSKETERAKDWDDIAYLEEAQDARLQAGFQRGTVELTEALAQIRSRRGFDRYLADGCFGDDKVVRDAIEHTDNPITQAFLLPLVPNAVVPTPLVTMEPIVDRKLRSVAPAVRFTDPSSKSYAASTSLSAKLAI